MQCGNTYTRLIKCNCANSIRIKDLAYWRNNLFAGMLIYLSPFCLIALWQAPLFISPLKHKNHETYSYFTGRR